MTKKTDDPRIKLDEWRHFNPQAARLYTCVIALRTLIQETNDQLVFRLGVLSATDGQDPYSVANTKGDVHHFAISDDARTFATVKALLEIAEKSEQFVTAKSELEPLMAAVAELEAKEDKARRAKLQAESALRKAEQEARDRALSLVGEDPAVVAARAALEKLPRD